MQQGVLDLRQRINRVDREVPGVGERVLERGLVAALVERLFQHALLRGADGFVWKKVRGPRPLFFSIGTSFSSLFSLLRLSKMGHLRFKPSYPLFSQKVPDSWRKKDRGERSQEASPYPN